MAMAMESDVDGNGNLGVRVRPGREFGNAADDDAMINVSVILLG